MHCPDKQKQGKEENGKETKKKQKMCNRQEKIWIQRQKRKKKQGNQKQIEDEKKEARESDGGRGVDGEDR